tara:strand:- start:28387 stop:29190 length:804 start_codon:yes stop_codon:yes gene_type:complete
MIYRYKLKTRKNEAYSFQIINHQNQTYELNDVTANWQFTPDGYFDCLIIDVEVPQDQLEFLGNGDINPRPLSCYQEAYAVAQRITDNIAVLSGYSILSPSEMLDYNVQLIGINSYERSLISGQRTLLASLSNIQIYPNSNDIKIDELNAQTLELNTIAAGHFIAGLESSDPTHQCECYFKVLESLFKKKKDSRAFDNTVSTHLSEIGTELPSDIDISALRKMRNDCTHPDRTSHINRRDRDALDGMHTRLEALKLIAQSCLLEPPNT